MAGVQMAAESRSDSAWMPALAGMTWLGESFRTYPLAVAFRFELSSFSFSPCTASPLVPCDRSASRSVGLRLLFLPSAPLCSRIFLLLDSHPHCQRFGWCRVASVERRAR